MGTESELQDRGRSPVNPDGFAADCLVPVDRKELNSVDMSSS